jgi:hypothetical protein
VGAQEFSMKAKHSTLVSRNEANDKLYFDTLKALEQRIDLCPLIRAAESGVWEACWKLWYITQEATEALNNLAEKQPELFRPFVRGCFQWPMFVSRNPDVSRYNQRFLEQLEQGEDLPFINIPKGKKGRTWSFRSPVNVFAFNLYRKIEIERAGYDYSKSMAELYGLTLPSWIHEAANLKSLSTKTWRNWAEIAWRIVLEGTDGKPERDENLRPLGESAGKKKPKYCKELHEGTINSNVRAKIKARLFVAFERNA